MTDESTPPAPMGTPSEVASRPGRAGDAPDHEDDRAGREHGDLVIAMSPRQVLGGFALLAGLILMLRRRRRNRN